MDYSTNYLLTLSYWYKTGECVYFDITPEDFWPIVVANLQTNDLTKTSDASIQTWIEHSLNKQGEGLYWKGFYPMASRPDGARGWFFEVYREGTEKMIGAGRVECVLIPNITFWD